MISELSINEFHRTLNEMTVEGTPSYKGSFFAFFTINFSNKPFYGYVSKSEKSTEVIRYLAEKSNRSFPIIGVGGIHSAEDAIEKLEATRVS